MTPQTALSAALEALQTVRRAYQRLPTPARVAVWAAVVAGPVLAFSSGGADPGDDGSGDAATAGAAESATSGASAADAPTAGTSAGDANGASAAGNGSFVRSIAAVQSFDLKYEMERIERAGRYATVDEEDDLDLDDAIDVLKKHIREASADVDVFKAIRKGPNGDKPSQLLAHSMPLMAAGDIWGAAATLLVAHELDEDDATPLVNLAAIANTQGLPGVALALLDAASKLKMRDDDSPMGIRERASLLNNRGHALLLLGRYKEAEKPLREALAMSPEMSEAARNLVHVLIKLGKREEARAVAPRAVWRLRGNPKQPVQVKAESGKAPASGTPPIPSGNPKDLKAWTESPYLVESGGRVSLPLNIALDLSRQGQIAWPEPMYPKPDATYPNYFPAASARYVAAGEAASAFLHQSLAITSGMAGKRMTISDVIQQNIEVRISPLWMMEPVDTEMHELDMYKENLILNTHQPTRFQALEVARAEYQMEKAADRFYERYYKEARCPAHSTVEACCAIERAATNRNIVDMTPIVREYEERMRVFFRDAYGLSTAIASNLPKGRWHDMARLDIEHDVQQFAKHTQQEIAFAFTHAAPSGDGCYGPVENPVGVAPDINVDAPACSEASQWASGKWELAHTFSMEFTCGKVKFVAEASVPGIRKINWGPLNDVGFDLGMHAEAEFSMDGTVTLFAGPKGGVAGKVGEVGADFGVKDGLYAVIGKDGIQDAGFRVVIGGGISGGPGGGTHDVDQMDFSFVSAI
jgi:tetratricopeptide (TPR) repeat protein